MIEFIFLYSFDWLLDESIEFIFEVWIILLLYKSQNKILYHKA